MATFVRSKRESGICNVCDACLQGTAEILKDSRSEKWPEKGSVRYKHHTSLESFALAVWSSCPFCLGLWNRYIRRPVESALSSNFESDWSALKEREKLEQCDFDFDWAIYSGQKDKIILDMSFGVESSPVAFDLYATSLLFTPTHTITTGALEALQMVKGWLTTCQEDHPQCSISDRWHPARLLHIVRHDKLRLVDTATYPVSGPYCTLSYCWGTPSKAPVLLTAESMSSLTSGIDVEDLPRTFRDAVKVCIELGVHYLWIDSLCIIQDDRADWERESRSMHKVYSYGYCNLSATASEDSDGGLFRTRPYYHDQRTRVDIHRTDNLISPGQYVMMVDEYADQQVENTPLQTRAWAFQERVLSPRNVHFGPKELVWECNTLVAVERGGLTWKLGDHGSPFWSSPKRAAYERDLIDEPSNTFISWLLDHWSYIQQSYSRRRLTYAGDRETALAGVVRVMESGYNQICTFGLWENHLLAGLVWERDSDQGCCVVSRPDKGSSNDREPLSSIPSFSWLAADGAIESFARLYSSFSCEMVHYDLRNVARVPNFRPHVLLCGQLRQVTIKNSSSEPLEVDVTLEGRHDWSVFDYASLDRNGQLLDILSQPPGSHFCLPLADRGYRILYILLQIKEQGSTTYRRIGCLTVCENKFEILKLPQKNEATFPCESYDPETGKYVIRIE